MSPERTVRLKLAERPDRDRIQRVVDLADALLNEAETLARDKAFTEEATRLKPWTDEEALASWRSRQPPSLVPAMPAPSDRGELAPT